MNNLKKFVLKYRIILVTIIALGVLFLIGPLTYTFLSTRGERFDLNSTSASRIPHNDVAIVLGAGILPGGKPTPYLKNRIATGVELYKAGRVEKLLMSGDNSSRGYSEPEVMRAYAIKLGMPKEDTILDHAGFNTYDSCYRAKYIFGLNNATIITQSYHLPRAMTTCRGLGVQNHGVAALRQGRDFTASYLLRELASTDKMLIQLMFKPTPTVLGEHDLISKSY